MKTPIVEFITPDKAKGERELSEEEQFDISLKNVINNASWKLTDVLLATPVVMSHILDSKDKFDPYDINPAVIVVDEFDELLQNTTFATHMVKILRKFASFQADKGNPLAEMNRLRQFIFTGATIPKSIATQSGSDAM
jgi:superfamily II DNA/RNA helicase